MRKRWFAKRKGVMALLKEAITREPSQLEDPDATAKTDDADAALAILGGDYASIGYFTPTVTLMDADPDRLADRVREVESAINRVGFVCKVEDVNAVEAWLGSPAGPGLCRSAPPARLLAEPLRHDADVGDLAGAVAQRPPDRRVRQARPSGRPAAADVRPDRRHHAVPLRPAPGRCRPHHDRRARPAPANRCC